MLSPHQVDQCLENGRGALVFLAAQAVRGETNRTEIYVYARQEHDALVCLLDKCPRREHGKIHDLLLRFDMMMASLVN